MILFLYMSVMPKRRNSRQGGVQSGGTKRKREGAGLGQAPQRGNSGGAQSDTNVGPVESDLAGMFTDGQQFPNQNLAQGNSSVEGTSIVGLNFNIKPSDTTQCAISAHSQIHSQVPHAIKEKIIKGLYIELVSLLSIEEVEDKPLGVNLKGNVVIKGQISKQITSIAMWTDAFLIYSSVFLEAHPEQTQNMLKYISNIRLGAKQYGGYGWRLYDQQFRMCFASDPVNWSFGKIDYELWLLFMASPTKNVQVEVSSRFAVKKCYDFNFRQCFKTACFYRHACLSCNGDHPSRSCQSGKRTFTVQSGQRGFTSNRATGFQPRSNFRPNTTK